MFVEITEMIHHEISFWYGIWGRGVSFERNNIFSVCCPVVKAVLIIYLYLLTVGGITPKHRDYNKVALW